MLGASKPLLDGYEDEGELEMEEAEGSLFRRRLRILNTQAAKALENFRKSNLSHSSMAYYYYQQNILLNSAASETEDINSIVKLAKEKLQKHAGRIENKPNLSRPK